MNCVLHIAESGKADANQVAGTEKADTNKDYSRAKNRCRRARFVPYKPAITRGPHPCAVGNNYSAPHSDSTIFSCLIIEIPYLKVSCIFGIHFALCSRYSVLNDEN